MNEPEVRDNLRKFITIELIRDREYELVDDEGIISEGLMDSFSLAELGVYIEGEFDVYIPDPELTVEQLDTLNQIVSRVMKG
jgi:acyl carrier protein